MRRLISTFWLPAGSIRIALPILLGILAVTFSGCEEVPSTPLLPPPSAPECAPQTPATNVNTITPTTSGQPVPGANLEDPQAVVAKFLNTPTNERKDTDILRLCNLSAGTESINNMDLNFAPVTDEGIKNLAKLQNLATINFASTRITEVGFAVTQELPKLRSLNLTNCNVSAGMLETLGRLENLEELSFERTQVGDSALAAIQNMAHLKSLNLTGTQISDNGFKYLDKLKSLEILKISNTGVRGQGMQFLKRKKGDTGLRVLDAQHSQFGAAGLQFLRTIETLEELDVAQADVTDRALLGLKGVNNLKKINLGFNQVTDQGLTVLSTMKGLEEVYLRNNSMVGDFTLTKTLSKNKDLRVLDINGTSCTINGVTSLKKLVPDCVIRFMGAEH